MQFQPFLTYLLTEKRCSPHTLEAYKSDLEQFLLFCKASYEIDCAQEVNQQIVRSWLAQLMDRKYSIASIHRKISSVKSFFRFLIKTSLLDTNPTRGIPKPKKPARLPVFLEEKSASEIYKSNHNVLDISLVRANLILKLLYETGIRQNELLNLKDSDIDQSLGSIKVLGKRNKMRIVPIGKVLMGEIINYQLLRNKVIGQIETSALLITDKGKNLSKTFLYLTVKSYLSQITTIKKKSPHVLRHTFATHMLNNGADLNVIKEVLGHSSLAATQVYTHNSIEKLKSIHTKMHPRNK